MSNGVDFRKMAVDLRGQLTAAQSELAALREELAKAKDDVGIAQRSHGKCQAKREDLQQSLTAAEQRNAEWQLLLEECIDSGQVDGILEEDIQNALALIKPTESGASE